MQPLKGVKVLDFVAGGSARYRIYQTADDGFIAAAPIEQKFWKNFCRITELPEAYWDDTGRDEEVAAAVAERIRAHPVAHWRAVFAGQHVCCSVVATLQDAIADPQFQQRGLSRRAVSADGETIDALPVPLDRGFGDVVDVAGYPGLGEANGLLDKEK